MTRPAGSFLFPRFFAATADFAPSLGGSGPRAEIRAQGFLDQLEKPLVDWRAEDLLIQGDLFLFLARLGIQLRLNQAVGWDGFSDSAFSGDGASSFCFCAGSGFAFSWTVAPILCSWASRSGMPS